MIEVINEWDLVESYCQNNDKCVVYFRNDRIKSATDAKKAEVWAWYAEFTEDEVLDAMKTLGTWDMIVFSNPDNAIANASAWFPPKADCPDEDYYWECHVVDIDGDFVWKNVDHD